MCKRGNLAVKGLFPLLSVWLLGQDSWGGRRGEMAVWNQVGSRCSSPMPLDTGVAKLGR